MAYHNYMTVYCKAMGPMSTNLCILETSLRRKLSLSTAITCRSINSIHNLFHLNEVDLSSSLA